MLKVTPTLLLVFLISFAFSQSEPLKIADIIPTDIKTGHPYGNEKNGVVFEKVFENKNSGYIKIHFSQFDLAPGDYVEITAANIDQSVRYTGKGKYVYDSTEQISMFWSQAILDEKVTLRLYSSTSSDHYGFEIDEVAYGYSEEEMLQIAAKAICGRDDKEAIACHEGTEMYEKAKSVCRLVIGGGSLCTGWLLGDEGHIMTNNHCIGSAAAALNTDFIFNYQRAACSGSTNARSDVVASTSTLICTNGSLDYTLVKLPTNPTNQYGFLSFRSTPPQVGERIYIPQHPGGRRKEIAVRDDQSPTGFARVTGNGNRVTYLSDTEGGSSGSPVLSYADNLVVALHNTGGCNNGSNRNNNIISHMGSCMPNNAVDFNPSVKADFVADELKSCDGSIQFTNTSQRATSYSWSFGDGNNSTATSPSHSYTNSGEYTVTLTARNADGASDNHSVTVNVLLFDEPTAEDVETCHNSSATLFATGQGGTFHWLDSDNNGTVLFTGNGFTTPELTNPATYYVQQTEGNDIENVGPESNTIGTGANHTSEGFGLLFDAEEDLTILSVKVFAQGAGNREFAVTDGVDGSVLSSRVMNLTGGEQKVNINLDVPAGEQRFLRIINTDVNLFRNDNGTSYPYTINNLVSITGSNASAPTQYYYYFYDWEVQEKNCSSDLVEVNVTLSDAITPPTVTDTEICEGETATATATGGNDNLVWYDDETDGQLLGTGSTIDLENLSSGTMSIWVEETNGSPTQTVGPADTSVTTGGMHTSEGFGLVFDALSPFILESVSLVAGTPGDREIAITDGVDGNVLMSKNVTLTTGEQEVALNFSIPQANDLFIRVINTDVNLYRSNNDPGFPFSIQGLVNIKESNASNPTNFYYYFYNWKVKEPGCSSERSELVIDVYENPEKPTVSLDQDGITLESTLESSYQWYMNDQMLSGETQQYLLAQESGAYHVVVSNEEGCTSSSDPIDVEIVVTGQTNELTSDDISVYPNPNDGVFYLDISSNTSKSFEITVHDPIHEFGKVFSEKVIGNQTLKLNLDNLTSGIYIIKITDGQTIVTKKLSVR